MRKGIVKISPQLFMDALGFPPDWEIESMSFRNCDGYITAVIGGSGFPEVTNIEGAHIRECRIIVHDKQQTFEVKAI
jgi:hypothetical protein